MLVKRKVANGLITLLGRSYKIPDSLVMEVNGQTVWVDDDGVLRKDAPVYGLCTAKQVPVFWPTRYSWFTNAKLKTQQEVK